MINRVSGQVSRLLHAYNTLWSMLQKSITVSKQFHLGSSFQSTLLFERHWDVQLPKQNKKPRIKRRHTIYKVVGVAHGPKELDVILTKDSLEHGVVGEVLTMDKRVARRLIRRLQAVYASPENLHELDNTLVSKSQQTTSARRLMLWLRKTHCLKCPMRADVEWTLTPEVACRALYRVYGLVVPKSAITLPEYSITSKNEDSWTRHDIKITVNNTDTVDLKMDVVRWLQDDEEKSA